MNLHYVPVVSMNLHGGPLTFHGNSMEIRGGDTWKYMETHGESMEISILNLTLTLTFGVNLVVRVLFETRLGGGLGSGRGCYLLQTYGDPWRETQVSRMHCYSNIIMASLEMIEYISKCGEWARPRCYLPYNLGRSMEYHGDPTKGN